jgi:ATP-binding cassette subfamily B protein
MKCLLESTAGHKSGIHQILVSLRLGRAVRLVWESAPGWTIAGALLVAVQGILPLVSLYLMKLIIDSVTAAINGSGDQASFLQTLSLIALAAGASLLSSLSRSALAAVGEAQAAHVSDYVQDILHSKSIEVDLEYYENSQYYDTLHRAQSEAPFRPARIVNGLLQTGQASISLLSIFVLLISFSWVVALVLMIAAIPGALIRIKFANKTYNWLCSRTSKERYAWYLHWLLTASDYAKEIRLFELGPFFKRQYSDLRQEIRGERLEITFRRSAMDSLAQAVGILAVFGSLAFIAYRAVQGIITLGDLVMYFGAFQQGQTFLNSLLTSLAGLYEDNLFLKSLYEFLDLKSKVQDPSSPKDLPSPMRMGISFEHVDFRYPGSDAMILEDLSLQIEAGQTIALVGENGSGKTTLIKLLCRLYDPVEGRIALDGIDLRDFRTSDLRKEISVVFQDYCHYNLTARENIWFGCADRSASMKDIIRASEFSGADKVISCLDHGYDTVLGKWFEDGVELSIGEWQKVALARAFMRDAQIVILDEPTSALDARAEEEVFQRFKELAEGRTTIIISHRLSTVKMADYIYFLKDGKIAERGTHRELVDKGGMYSQMFEIQAKHYR